jgi:hypothetical protein
MSRIHLTIDKLVLGGLDPAAREAFVTRLKGELARILADPTGRAAWARTHRTPVLRLGRLSLLGSQVAQGIARGLKP